MTVNININFTETQVASLIKFIESEFSSLCYQNEKLENIDDIINICEILKKLKTASVNNIQMDNTPPNAIDASCYPTDICHVICSSTCKQDGNDTTTTDSN